MRLLPWASAAGFSAVALGAFGAHGLTGFLASRPDGPQRLEWWKTGASYHLAHALALGLVAVLVDRAAPGERRAKVAAIAFGAGILLFSGSLYAMTLTGIRALGAVTPFGGLAFLTGWVALGLTRLTPSGSR